MKSTSLWAALDEAVALTRVLVVKWNSLGTVDVRTNFFGGGSEISDADLLPRCKPEERLPDPLKWY